MINRGTSVETQWLYPDLANRWSGRIWEATHEATAELFESLDKIEAQPAKAPPVRGSNRQR